MQPDQSRLSYPAFRAWFTRLCGCWLVAVLVSVAAQFAVGVWLDGMPRLLVFVAALAAGAVVAVVTWHVVGVLLHDYKQAALRELEANRVELERRWGLREGGRDGTA